MYIPKDENFNGRSDAANGIRAVHAVVKAARAARSSRIMKVTQGRRDYLAKRAREGVEILVDIAKTDNGPAGVGDASVAAVETLHNAGPTQALPLIKGMPPQSSNGVDTSTRSGDWSAQPTPKQALIQGAPLQAASIAQANLPATQDQTLAAIKNALAPKNARHFATGQFVARTKG